MVRIRFQFRINGSDRIYRVVTGSFMVRVDRLDPLETQASEVGGTLFLLLFYPRLTELGDTGIPF
jgi:hypothetical protein